VIHKLWEALARCSQSAKERIGVLWERVIS
jgi:hypothetical protein